MSDNGKQFQRRVEDFICEHCNVAVKGTGYTNHCPACLWSKHVDIYPGDRAEPCGGMMRPVGLEGSSPEYRIVHRCERCNLMRRVTAAENDSLDALVELAKRRVKDEKVE